MFNVRRASASAAGRARPSKTFAAGHEPEITVFDVGRKNGKSAAFILTHSQHGVVETASVREREKGEESHRTIVMNDLENLAAAHPTLREMLVHSIALNDETLPVFARFEELEVLSVTGVDLSPAGLTKLNALKSLKVLKGWMPDETRTAIRQALPNCELHFE